ncbi:hypothetical protein HK099_004922 [Clydaea vesicula]|uniref:C2H2-type domain-containing protein n=1 Tax=Clydaea vesicula TaxID=447962 RepID=A0AAD5XZA4_9FUNG|nr:hypothetical protein HK099_004922 [Clydaea vesicula]
MAFETEMELMQHILISHNKSHECLWVYNITKSPCLVRLKNYGQFRDHMISHFSLGFKPLSCNICGKKIRNRQEMWHHKKTHQSETTEVIFYNDKNKKIAKDKQSLKTISEIIPHAIPEVIYSPLIEDTSKKKKVSKESIANKKLSVSSSDSVEENSLMLDKKCNMGSMEVNSKLLQEPSKFFPVGLNICIFWRGIEGLSYKLCLPVPLELKKFIFSIFNRDGKQGRIPSATVVSLQVHWLKSKPHVLYNQKLQVRGNIAFSCIEKDFTLLLTENLNSVIETLNKAKNIPNFSQGMLPFCLEIIPLKNVLRAVGCAMRDVITSMITNEDEILMFEPNKYSALYKHPGDCSGSALLFKINVVKNLDPFFTQMRKRNHMALGGFLKSKIQEAVISCELSKNLTRCCCIGYICYGELFFNLNCFENVHNNDVFLMLRIGNEKNYSFDDFVFTDFDLLENNLV